MPIHYVVFIISGTILGVWAVAWCIGRCCFNQYGAGSVSESGGTRSIAV